MLDAASVGGSPHASRRWAWTGVRAVQAEGRKASGASRWTRRLLAVRPTPHGVGLGQEFVSYKPKAVRPRVPHVGRGVRWRFTPRITALGLDGCVASASRLELAARPSQPRRRRKAYIADARPMPESTIAGGSGTASTFIRMGDEVLVVQLVPLSLV